MTNEGLTDQVIKLTQEIAAMRESMKSAHKRIDDNDRITEGIHEIAASVKSLALQVKLLTERVDKNIEKLETGQKSQGERLGALERTNAKLSDIEETVEEQEKRIDAIEKEPATKWKTLVSQVIAIIVAAIVGYVLSKFF